MLGSIPEPVVLVARLADDQVRDRSVAVILGSWRSRRLVERKIARLTCRSASAPTGSGRSGWLQPIADAFKLFVKEDIVPAGAEKAAYFMLAPMLLIVPALVVSR